MLASAKKINVKGVHKEGDTLLIYTKLDIQLKKQESPLKQGFQGKINVFIYSCAIIP